MTSAQLEQARARDKALWLLGMRDHFRAELADKLRRSQAAFSPEAIADAVAYIEEQGLFREASLAARLARDLRDRKGFAPPRVRQELLRRGCPAEVAAEAVAALAEEDEEGDPVARARALLERRRFTPELLREEKQRRRAAGMLARMGYGVGVIRRAMDG